MKLRNKKTGEIVNFESTIWNEDSLRILDDNGIQLAKYNSLAELNEEWEDYEEPKEYWFVNSLGESIQPSDTTDWAPEDVIYHKAIGNYFETKKEAERAVEKLKAWKRLKDKGFKFNKWNNDTQKYLGDFIISAQIKNLDNIIEDLDLIFGGKNV